MERKVIEAQEFALVDEAGVLRAAFTLNAENAPVIEMRDESGAARLQLGIISDGQRPALALRDANETTVAMMSLTAEGRGELRLYDASGDVRAELIMDDDGVPILAMLDFNGKPRLVLRLSEEGEPGVSEEGEPVIVFLNENGEAQSEITAGGFNREH
jgi:hypothetical protein